MSFPTPPFPEYSSGHSTFPNDAAVIRLAGALLSEQNDEWLVQRRYLSAESMQLILATGWTEENSLEQQQQKEVAELNAA